MVKRIKKYSRKRERQRGGSIHTIEIVNHGNTPKGQAMNKVEATLAINKLKMKHNAQHDNKSGGGKRRRRRKSIKKRKKKYTRRQRKKRTRQRRKKRGGGCGLMCVLPFLL